MANMNFANIIESANLHLAWMISKAEFTDASALLSEKFDTLDTLAPGAFSLERSKGLVKFCVNPDTENLVDILNLTADERKIVGDAVCARNTAYEAYRKLCNEQDKYLGGKDGKKALNEAFAVYGQTNDSTLLSDCWRNFLHELGMPEDQLDSAFDKWFDRILPTLSAGQYRENCKELTGKYSETKGARATGMMWACLHTFLTSGLNTYKKDDKGEYVYKVGKNGRKTGQHEIVVFGGNFAVDFNEEECRMVYINRLKNGLEKTDKEGAKAEAKKALESAKAVA